MAQTVFNLPDLGEGLTESVLVSWHVAEGDTVTLNQPIAEVETAKALVELPSPFEGVIAKLHVEAGTTVDVGAPIVTFDTGGGDAASSAPEDAPATAAATEQDGEAPAQREPVLVGYGAPVDSGKRPARRARKGAGGSDGQAEPPRTSDGQAEVPRSGSLETTAPTERTRSTPPVRKLARDLGVDINALSGTGPKGLVTREDVEAAASGALSAPAASALSVPAVPLGQVDESRVTRVPIQGVRKHTAMAMVSSAFTAPHVTEFLTIDVTESLELLETLKQSGKYEGVRLNLLTLVAKAVCISVARNPGVNVRWDEAAGEIIQFNYLNLGIAAATPRGLMVPNIKDAHTLDLRGLAEALADLTSRAKEGRSTQEELAGGTLSITNVGVFGIDAGTPILPPGEAMILALGAARRLPWEHKGEIALRSVLTLSCSFDHRMIDGELGSHFLADVGAILASPASLIALV